MAVIGSATVTLTQYRDIQSVTRYYKLQPAGSSAPLKPETKPPSSDWTDSEPACDISKELYFCDLTIFSNGEGEYSKVSKSTSYEAAKQAYNKAQSAKDGIDNLEIGGRNLLLNTADNTYYPAISTDSVYVNNTTSGYPNQNIVCTADGVNNRGYRYTWLGGNTGINLWKYLSVNLDYLIKHNKYLTFSVEIKTTGKLINPYITLSMRIDNSKIYNITASKIDGLDDGIWRRYEVTKDMSSALAETYTCILFLAGWDKSEEEGSTLEWRNLKLEIGNKATDWTPAPEDVDAGIANAQTSADNAQTGVDSINEAVFGIQTFNYILNGVTIPAYKREDGTYYYILNDEEVTVAESALVHDAQGDLTSYQEGGVYEDLEIITGDIEAIDTKVNGFDAREDAIYKAISDNSLIARKNARVEGNSLIITNDTATEAIANLLNYLQLNADSIVIYGNGKDIVTIAKTADDSGYMKMNGTSMLQAQESRLSTIRLRSADGTGNLAFVAGSDGHVSLREVLN